MITKSSPNSRSRTYKQKRVRYLTDAQFLLLQRYNAGAYRHLALARNLSQFELELQACADPVLTALLALFSSDNGCVNLEQAKLRVTPLLNALSALNTDLYQDPCRI